MKETSITRDHLDTKKLEYANKSEAILTEQQSSGRQNIARANLNLGAPSSNY